MSLTNIITVILLAIAFIFVPALIAQAIYIIYANRKAKNKSFLYKRLIEIASAPCLELWQRYKLIYQGFEAFGYKVSNVFKYEDKLQIYIDEKLIGEVSLPSEWD